MLEHLFNSSCITHCSCLDCIDRFCIQQHYSSSKLVCGGFNLLSTHSHSCSIYLCTIDSDSAMESTSHVQLSRRAWVLLLAFSCLLAHQVVVHASDPDPLQDFCVADFSTNAPRVNGFPCKPRSNVTAKDFVFTGLRSGPAGYGKYIYCLIVENSYDSSIMCE